MSDQHDSGRGSGPRRRTRQPTGADALVEIETRLGSLAASIASAFGAAAGAEGDARGGRRARGSATVSVRVGGVGDTPAPPPEIEAGQDGTGAWTLSVDLPEDGTPVRLVLGGGQVSVSSAGQSTTETQDLPALLDRATVSLGIEDGRLTLEIAETPADGDAAA